MAQVEDFLQKNENFENAAAVINLAIDKFFELCKTNPFMDFMYFTWIGMFPFLVALGLTLYLPSFYFYIVTVVTGVYLVVFTFLFYNKYKGIKWK